MSVPGTAATVSQPTLGNAEAIGQTVRISPVRLVLATVHLRFRPLWAEVQAFSSWVEHEALASSTGEEDEYIRIDLRDELAVKISGTEDSQAVAHLQRLWRFLSGLGIHQIELDGRLESNQVSDLLLLLWAHRREIRRRRPTALVEQLEGEDGISFACTVTRLDGDTLTSTYSYCVTRFSRMVRWFEQRQRHFRDHRALFRAAPRYGLALSLAVMGVFVGYAFNAGFWFLLVVSLLGSAFVFAATYLFFMTVGSVEYDNEEKAQRLARAYAQQQLHAARIRFDLDRARTVQQSLLPNLDDMPHSDQLEWAGSFVPVEQVGGDYFDVATLGPGRIAMLFADVSGHGLSAALVTVIIKTRFQTWLEQGGGLVDYVEALNHHLREMTPTSSFAAVVVATYDVDRRELTYCNCGHSPEPYLIPVSGDGPQVLDQARTAVLGVFEQITPAIATIELEPGDSVFLATDGLTEATDSYGEMFGADNLERYLSAQRGESLQEIVDGLVREVEGWADPREEADDRAILALRLR